MSRNTYVTSDIHGNYRALMQCIERSEFDYNSDTLIVNGDIPDGLPDTKQCVNELLKIKNLIVIKGNHENFLLDTLESGCCAPIHYQQGGKATMESYNYDIPKEHRDFFKSQLPYYIDSNNNLFVHGGIPIDLIDRDIKNIDPYDLTWDRTLIYRAYDVENTYKKSKVNKVKKFGNYNKIFVGHTSTLLKRIGENTKPLFCCNLIDTDTGAGWGGRLTFMNINTLEYVQSDLVKELYPDYNGR